MILSHYRSFWVRKTLIRWYREGRFCCLVPLSVKAYPVRNELLCFHWMKIDRIFCKYYFPPIVFAVSLPQYSLQQPKTDVGKSWLKNSCLLYKYRSLITQEYVIFIDKYLEKIMVTDSVSHGHISLWLNPKVGAYSSDRRTQVSYLPLSIP